MDSDFDQATQNLHIESRIVASLERIAQAFRVLLWQVGKEYSLSPVQIQVLIFLKHHSGSKRKVSYLAQEFNVTKATISDTIKALEKKKLIYKVLEPLDTRSYIINLTEKGSLVADRTSSFSREIRTPIDALPDSEKEALLLSLFTIIRHLNRTEVITVKRMCTSCHFYRDSHKGKEHFCGLLNEHLHVKDLRLDCPEHMAINTQPC